MGLAKRKGGEIPSTRATARLRTPTGKTKSTRVIQKKKNGALAAGGGAYQDRQENPQTGVERTKKVHNAHNHHMRPNPLP